MEVRIIKFCKTLWGNNVNGTRREKIDEDIKFTQAWTKLYYLDFTVYCYGKDNENAMIDAGFKTKLIYDKNFKYPDEHLWMHKINSFQEMAKDNDRFVYLDHDVALTSKLPDNFNHMFNGKQFLGSLRYYHNRKIPWDKIHPRKTVCASWLFMSNLVPDELEWIWGQLGKPRKEEIILRRWCELNGMNGKFTPELYWQLFEPHNIGGLDLFHLQNETVYHNRTNRGKSLFRHYNQAEIAQWYKNNPDA